MTDKYLDRSESAEYLRAKGLKVAKTYLQKMVTTGGGPTFRKFGSRVVYSATDLDAWAAARLSAPRCTNYAASK